ncbi:hypothetical protein WKI65_23630 [Streptomyces sp. MS1.AVA.3]|uniref:hypothetical protein n=1 Tax=Streptomyces decoyicus TaxID=249567 RepID=UPI0030C26B7E
MVAAALRVVVSAADEGVRRASAVRPAVHHETSRRPAADVLIACQPLPADGCAAAPGAP